MARPQLKLSVEEEAREVVKHWSEVAGMKDYVVATRIYTWFAEQPEAFQRTVLGLLGGFEGDVAKAYLERLAAEDNRQAEQAEDVVQEAERAVEASRPGRKGKPRRSSA